VAGIERLVTHKGQTLTVTGRRTGGVTQQLVIPLWTLRPAVTHVVAMETNAGRSAPIMTWAFDVITADLVLAPRAVLDPVTPEVHWQTIHRLARTKKVGLWTRKVIGVHTFFSKVAHPIHVNNGRRGRPVVNKVCILSVVGAVEFITGVQAVVLHIAHHVVWDILPASTPVDKSGCRDVSNRYQHRTLIQENHSINIVKNLAANIFNSVSNDSLPFMVGLHVIHDGFTLLSVKCVMLFLHCQQTIQLLCTRYRQGALWSKPGCQCT
jgi:hypothetical protein